jgi:pyruvate/2-oxoglutarate dehydrogenase complex dihydrolipoamide dehydrogenase (E3) component
MPSFEVDAAIIGAGQAGVPLARALANAGKQVTLIEAKHLGGSCVNFGCTPSKAMIASARLAAQARRAAEWGLRIAAVEVDFAAVMNRTRSIVRESTDSLDASFKGSENPRLIKAWGRLDGRDGERFRIRAGDDIMLARQVVLDTGNRTVMPGIPGLDQVPCITAETWVGLTKLPEQLIFLGGGTISLEMAQAFRRLGSAVTIIESAPRLAAHEDPEVSQAFYNILISEDIEIHLRAEAERIQATDGKISLHLKGGALVTGSHIFIAAGRRPNTDQLGLETVGVTCSDKGMVEVDKHLRTSTPGIWAAGDIRGGPQFTHTAYDDFGVIEAQMLGNGGKTTDRIIGYAVFTEPELGRVGMTEAQAREAGHDISIGRYEMKNNGKAREIGYREGFIKVIAETGTNRILGAAVLAADGAETVQLYLELMNAGATTETMLNAVHIHPTFGEAAKNAIVAIK